MPCLHDIIKETTSNDNPNKKKTRKDITNNKERIKNTNTKEVEADASMQKNKRLSKLH